MAEIHVERKRGVGNWVWLLLLALIIIAAVVYFWQAGYIDLSSTSVHNEVLAHFGWGGSHGA
jgi:hypothetical protein